MAYGILKVDTITFTDGGVDKSVTISGLVQNPTFTGNVTATGTISGNTVRGQTISGVTVTGTTAQFASGTFVSLTGATLQGTTATYTTGSFTSLTGTTTSGTTANFVSGVFSTQISGATVTGTTANFTSGNFTNISGGTHTITSGVFALGTAANPSISFTSDPNTGIYSPGADQVAISTNGTGRLFIDASGNVGLGTSAPNVRLDVVGSARIGALGSVNFTLDLGQSGVGTTRSAFLNGNSGNVTFSNQENGFLSFHTNNTERMRLDSSGRLGLGTTSVAALLHLNGGSAALPVTSGTTQSAGNRLRLSTATGSGILDVGCAGGSGMWLQSTDSTDLSIEYPLLLNPNGGSVGIGTQTPGSYEASAGNLVVADSGNGGITIVTGASSYGSIYFADGTTSADKYRGVLEYNHSNNAMAFWTDATERARIDSSGRLLVGTSTSLGTTAKAIEAASNIAISSFIANEFSYQLTFNKSRGATNGTIVQNGDEIGKILFRADDGTDTDSTAAQITAAVDGTPGANDMPGRLVFSTTADGASSPTERMRITSGGNILIGGTLPSSPNAEIRANGQFRCLNSPLPQSKTYLKYAGSATARTLDVAAEIDAMVAGGATWSQALVALRGFDGGSVGYWHGIYSNGPAGGGVRATQIASSGEITLTVNGGQLDWTGPGSGQWYNTYITITLGAF